jgi:hypothetical protein
LPFACPATVRQDPQVADFTCLLLPHAQTPLARQAGQRLWRLEGWNTLPHSLHSRPGMWKERNEGV